MSELIAGDFNYASVDEETATKLEYFAKSGKALYRKHQIQFLADMGKLLSEAQALLANHKGGTFIKWATAEFDIDKSTVYRYINAWERVLSQACDNYLHWSQGALYLAAADDFPKPVMKKLEKIPATDLVRTSDVKRLVEANKPKPEPESESNSDDDVPFDTAPTVTVTPAQKKKAEAEAAREKKKADAESAAQAKKEKAAADRAAKKLSDAAAKEKKKADDKAAKDAAKLKKKQDALKALPKDEAAKKVRSILNQLIGQMMRSADDLQDISPNRTKHAALIKTLKDIQLW